MRISRRRPALLPLVFALGLGFVQGASTLNEALDEIILPRLQIQQRSLEDAITDLRKAMEKADPDAAKLVRIEFDEPGIRKANPDLWDQEVITLDLQELPVREALRYIVQLGDVHMEEKTDHIVITSQRPDQIIDRTWLAEKSFGFSEPIELQQFLEKRGIEFGENSSINIHWGTRSHFMKVRNTRAMMEKTAAILKEALVPSAPLERWALIDYTFGPATLREAFLDLPSRIDDIAPKVRGRQVVINLQSMNDEARAALNRRVEWDLGTVSVADVFHKLCDKTPLTWKPRLYGVISIEGKEQ